MNLLSWRLAAVPVLGATLVFGSDVSAQEVSLAATLATGANVERVQQRVDALEKKAIANAPFSADDKRFLRDLYAAMALGAKRSIVFRQSGRMMERYLDGTGADLELDAAIFSKNTKVRAQMQKLAAQMSSAKAEPGRVHRSPRFYMPDASSLDSVTGLYWGTIQGSSRVNPDGSRIIHYRAEVPWEWPSYDSLRKRYGTPHAETFALPNLRSVVEGPRYALHIENGLGEYLVRLGLAKSFLAYAEWDEQETALTNR